MGKIPEGWLPYSPIGNQVPGTRFIAFKVPLREVFFQAFVDKLKAEDRFTINLLLDKIPDLGLVIDLTHTTKYYNKREFLDRGVDYVKIQTPGQSVPPQHLVERFFEVVDYYLDSHKNDNTLIGVHCTHGVNRTGYMLCRYLIQRLGYSFNEAVEAVGRARGHMIERSHYLASLQANRDSVKKKPTVMRGIEESKTKIIKKDDVAPKKEEIVRRAAGKDGFRGDRGDYRSSPGRVSIAPPGRPTHRRRSRTPPRGRSPPLQVRDRTPPMPPIKGRPSPPRYDRPVTGQTRDRGQTSVMRDRMPPPMPRGRTPPPQLRGRTPPVSFRSRSPPPAMQMSHRSPPSHMRNRVSPPPIRTRSPPNIMRGRSPPRHQGRGRSPPPDMIMGRLPSSSARGRSPPPSHMRGRSPHMRGGSPSGHIRSRSPQYRSGRSPPPHSRGRSPLRGRSPGRPIRGRTPPIYGRATSPGHGQPHIARPPTPTSGHGHQSRRDHMISGSRTSPNFGPPTRRDRTPPSAQTSRRPHSPDFRRNEPIDRHYGIRPGYEDNRRAAEERSERYDSFKDERFQSNNSYNNERGYGSSTEYYPERYEKPRRERSLSPRHQHSYYQSQREEGNTRPEYSPPRDTKRRRKSPPAAEVREKVRRSSPPSGYMNSREGFKKEKREYSSMQWDHVKDKDGPDCREILNEKRSMRDTYSDQHHTTYGEGQKFPSSNPDLREALEEEKRRRHGHVDQSSYHGQDMAMDNRNIIHSEYTAHGSYQYRPEGELERGRTRQDYGGGASNYDASVPRSEHQRHTGFQNANSYSEPAMSRPPDNEFIKPIEEEFRKTRGRRGKQRVFDRLSRGGGRGRGGGHGYWP